MTKKPSLFVPVVPESGLSFAFNAMRSHNACAPARDEMQQAFELFEDVDGNFVQQFQTVAYEARLFELFLGALFRHEGFKRDTTHNRPDFLLTNPDGIDLCVEAVTANPSEGDPPAVLPVPPDEDFEERFRRVVREARDRNDALAEAAATDEFRSRLIRPLNSKLKKEYWNLSHVSGKPLVIAVQDFHAEGSLLLMNGPFAKFLYSDFFHRKHAEHVAAVMFVNTGTASKFNRMRYQALKDAYPKIAFMQRAGWHWVSSDELGWFHYHVGDPARLETWSQGITVFHHPDPVVPLDASVFAGTKQVLWRDGLCSVEEPPFHPEASITVTFSTYEAGPQ